MEQVQTIAVDFDGVLHAYDSPFTKPWEINDGPVDGAIAWLRSVIPHYRILIHTARFDCDNSANYLTKQAIDQWLLCHGLSDRELRAINYHTHCGKPQAEVYIDDRAWRFVGSNYPTPEEIRKAIPWNKIQQT